jgi:GNAT superfamily N-acetyltransferase
MRLSTGSHFDAFRHSKRSISHPLDRSPHLKGMSAFQTDSPIQDAKGIFEDSTGRQVDTSLLDNPIWNALLTDHASLALVDGNAKRYPPEIGPLSGVPDQSKASYDSLRALAGPGGILVLFFPKPPTLPSGWTLFRGGLVDQMICTTMEDSGPVGISPTPTMRRLTPDDIAQMLALAELTEPGPFRKRTMELGTFYGVFDSGRLLAMAGQRMHLPGLIEVSAVCTHPDARGRGYARTLMSHVIRDIRQLGRIPFLHVLADNESAIRVYQHLGFTRRCTFHLAVLKNED